MKKILVIDESPLFRNFLVKKLSSYGFEVKQGTNGLDGWVKLRSEMPDLIIMDYYLSRKSSGELLEDKSRNRNVASIPVIMAASQIDRRKVVELASFKVNKIISKPLRMEQLMESISSILGVELATDETPCVIEAHFNENILFIEISQGLNNEKIEQLQYKINELLELYQVRSPKVLIMMSNLDFPAEHHERLDILLKIIIKHAQPNRVRIKILTGNQDIRKFVEQSEDLKEILVYDNLNKAMDSLLGLKADSIAHDEVVREKLLKSTAPKKDQNETIQMRFDGGPAREYAEEHDSTAQSIDPGETPGRTEEEINSGIFDREVEVAIVDDDMVIQELVKTVFSETKWRLMIYENGEDFIQDRGNHSFSLAFLDLMMPRMNGFQVLEHMKKENDPMPVIVFSALSRQETVIKAVSYGIRSYLTKPLKPEQLLRKAAEVLSLSF